MLMRSVWHVLLWQRLYLTSPYYLYSVSPLWSEQGNNLVPMLLLTLVTFSLPSLYEHIQSYCTTVNSQEAVATKYLMVV